MDEEDISRLQRRITAFALAGVLLTGLVVGTAAALPQYWQARERAEQELRFHTQVQALAVGQVLERWHDVARQLSSRSEVRSRLAAYNRGEIGLEALRAFSLPRLRDGLAGAQGAVGLLRLDAYNRAVVRLGDLPPLPELRTLPLDRREPAEWGPFGQQGQYLLVITPIVDRQGRREGSDIVVFATAGLKAVVRRAEAGGEQRAFIAHRSRVLGVGAEPAAAPGRLLASAGSAGQALSGPVGPGLVAAAAPVPVPGWTLALAVPGAALYADVGRAMLPPLLSVLLMALFGLFATGRLIRPLAERAAGQASELAATAAAQRLVLDNARDFVYRQELGGRYAYVSPAVEAVTGYPASDWLAGGLTLTPLDDALPDDGVHGTYLLEFRHRDGRPIVLEVNEALYREADGPGGVVGIARDVTDRVGAERALTRATVEWNCAMDFFDDAIVIVDLEDRVLRANRAFYTMLGRSAVETVGRVMADLMHPPGQWERCPCCRARRAHADSRLVLERDGSPWDRPLEVNHRVVRDSAGHPKGVLAAMRDLSGARRTEQELMLAASVFEGSYEAIAIADPQRRILRVNRAFVRLTDLAAEAAAGRPFEAVLSATGQLPDSVWTELATTAHAQGETLCRRGDGELFPAWYRISAQRDAGGGLMHYILAFSDITDKKRSEQRINHLAYYDPVTNLPNRSLLQERLHHALDRVRRQRHQLAVLLLDLDRFKNINDTFGHQVGDEVLRRAGKRLRACVREDDTVARLGGDEFALVLEDIEGVPAVEGIARKLLEAMARPVVLAGRELFVGASIGISLFPEDGADAETLLKHADSAMYRAKERGRNTHDFYTPELTRLTSERLQLENDLRRALERDELLVYYQPQARVAGGEIIGAEALVRWLSPERGLVPPGAFIPLAEETGLIGPLGRHVLFAACRQTAEWARQGHGLRVAVNLAGGQILQGDIVAEVARALRESELDPALLELEITEGFVMSRPDDGIETLRALKRLGATLAIDDFGTGYASLGYLKRLPVDRLKIDRSFVSGLPDDRDDAAIASTIIAIAGHLDLEVIAEGVETPAQLEFLRRNGGCQEFQGFHLARPLPPGQFAELLAGHRPRESGGR